MSISDYLREIEERKGQGLHPKPIDGAELLSEIITQIKDIENADRAESLHFHLQYRAGYYTCSWC
jgi:aconitate hydratase 2/2-methylisocitrate dehydratase